MAVKDHVDALKAMATKPQKEFSITVAGEVYNVRYSDFLMISGACGRAILVRPAAVPPHFVTDLILAYRAGQVRGRNDARREIRDAMEDE